MAEKKRNFKKLSNVEHVRLRTGMWLGQNSISEFSKHFFVTVKDGENERVQIEHREILDIPAKLKCLDEVCMNAVDEFNRTKKLGKSRKNIRMDSLVVSLSDDRKTLSVKDNGRGIPAKNAEGVFLHLMYGENFDDKIRKEHVAGQNGVGVSLVRIVSKHFLVETTENGKRYTKRFTCSPHFLELLSSNVQSGELDSKCAIRIKMDYDETGSFDKSDAFVGLSKPIKKELKAEAKRSQMTATIKKSPANEHGTRVAFQLDPIYFEGNEIAFDLDYFRQYLSDIAMNNPGLRVKWIHQKKEEEFFFKKGLDEVVSKLGVPVSILEKKDKNDQLKSFVIGGEGKTLSWVNSNFVSLGGSAIEYFENRLCDEVRKRPFIQALEKRLKTTVTRNDVRRCFHVLHTFSLQSPRFKSQDKSYLINDLKESIRVLIGEGIEKTIRKLSLLEKIKEHVEKRERFRLMENASKELKKQKRTFIPKFIPPASKPGTAGRTLLIAEGDSAIAGLRPVRDPFLHGLFPLRGKPLNVNNMSLAKALQNEEIKNLVHLIGLPLSSEKSKTLGDLNFSRVCIITDADYDGFAIRSLLLSFFLEYWPSLFLKGILYLAEAPLYEVILRRDSPKKNNSIEETHYCLDDDAFNALIEQSSKEGKKLIRKKRNKGLGETSVSAMQYTLKNCQRQILLGNEQKSKKKQTLWFSKKEAQSRRLAISRYARLFFEE